MDGASPLTMHLAKAAVVATLLVLPAARDVRAGSNDLGTQVSDAAMALVAELAATQGPSDPDLARLAGLMRRVPRLRVIPNMPFKVNPDGTITGGVYFGDGGEFTDILFSKVGKGSGKIDVATYHGGFISWSGTIEADDHKVAFRPHEGPGVEVKRKRATPAPRLRRNSRSGKRQFRARFYANKRKLSREMTTAGAARRRGGAKNARRK